MDSVSEQIHDWYTQWNRIEQAYSRWAAENGLTDAMLSCLIFLQKTEQACTQQKICMELSLPKQTVSAALLSLEKKSWIIRRASASDHRIRTVLFTPEGKARTEALLSGLHQTERRAFLSLTEEERAQFIRIGGLLARRLTQQFNSDI